MEFQNLKELIPQTINRLGLTNQTRAAQVCYVCTVLLKEKWGEVVLEDVKPRSFRNGVLYISVSHAGWAQEVQMIKEWLLLELKTRIGETDTGVVKQIRVTIRGE